MADLEDVLPWVALQLVPGVGSEAYRRLLAAFGLPDQILGSPVARLSQVVDARLARAIAAGPPPEAMVRARAWLSTPGNWVVTLADADYPRALLEIHDPPPLLYGKGRVELLAAEQLAIVGSRNATPQGVRDAEAFAQALSDAGFAITSGLALGIDAAAHRGGLAGASASVAVVGTGLDIVYPAANRRLAHRLAEEGAIVSEFPLGTPARAGHFPRRNRLIAGLSRGVLVVEAAPQSGSLITARLAAEQGREVFAVPGSIHSPLSRGCHRLIREGAKLVESAEDVLEELTGRRGPMAPEREMPGPAEGVAGAVLAALGDAPRSIDALVARSGLTPEKVSAVLLELELAGRVAALPGGLYQALH